MRKAVVAIILIACAATLSVAAARWIVPVTEVVGFNYTGSAYINVSFDVNNSADGYAQLAPSEEKVSGNLADSYVPDGQACAIYDSDARFEYVFDGWYTLPEGGKKVGEDITLLQAADGANQVTLYAHWKSKCPVEIIIDDKNFNVVDGQCTFYWTGADGQEFGEYCTSSQTGTFTYQFFIAEGQSWRISTSTAAGEKLLEGVPVEYGHSYSYKITIYATGIVSAPSSVQDNLLQQ